MREGPWAPVPVDFSVRLYSWLLGAYPGRFRAEYGHHMAQVFRDVCRREYRRRGLAGMAALWARTSLDLVRSAIEEHIERGLNMNREKFVRWSGWALIAGAILFAAGMIIGSLDSYTSDPIGGVDGFYEISQFGGALLGEILFVIGLVGLHTGFAGRSGGLGRALLIGSIYGGGLSVLGILGFLLGEDSFGWYAWSSGFLTMTLALAIYGVVAIRRHVFSRWNFAPLLAGVTFLVLLGTAFGPESAGGSLDAIVFRLGVSAMSIGLLLIGYRMQADGAAGAEAVA